MKELVRRYRSLLLLLLALSFGGRTDSRLIAQAISGSGEFILCAKPERIAAVAARHGLTVIGTIDAHDHGVVLVRGPVPGSVSDVPPPGEVQTSTVDTNTQQLIAQVRADSDVEHFELNGPAVLSETPPGLQLNQSTVDILDSLGSPALTSYFGTSVWGRYVNQPAMAVIRLPEAQQLANGSGVVVAVIDTGVDPNHPALQGSLVPGYDFTRNIQGPASEWADLNQSTVDILDSATPPVIEQSAPVPVNQSTTAIMSASTASALDLSQLPTAFGHGTMVAGLVHLVAPSARIMPLKAFTASGTATMFDIERAIYYAIEHGAKVINMSFSMATISNEITHALDLAGQQGVIAVASVGNAGQSVLVYPAAFRNVLGIGSTTVGDQRSTFSNYGDHLAKLAAPGEMLITLYPGYRYAAVSGTSFSTALVVGGAALLSQIEPTVDQKKAARYFDDGAVKPVGLLLGDGRIDLYETLRKRANVAPPPPPPADTTAPTVTLTSPADGASVTGTITLAAGASDDVGVVGVQFTLDGVNLGAEATVAPYQLAWNSGTVPNGPHALAAVARDAAGNQQSAKVTVTVANDTTPPTVTVTSPADTASVSGTVTLAADASDNVGVVGVQFTLDGANLGTERAAAPYQVAWNSGTVPNGPHVLAAVARDAAGNQQSASVSVTVANDTTPPTVTVTSPADNANVSGTVTLAADASDNVGVVGVQFTLDGVNLGAEATVAPYQLAWNSGTTPDGVHVLGVIARDAAGNQKSASIAVSVLNAATPG